MKVLWFVLCAILLALILLCFITPAQAGSCGTVYHAPYVAPTYSYSTPYVAPVKVVKEVVAVPTFLPVAVYPIVVPSYAASYNPNTVGPPAPAAYTPPGSIPQGANAAPQGACAETKALTSAVLKVLERLESLEKRSTLPPQPPAVPEPGTPKGRGPADPFNPGTGGTGGAAAATLRVPNVLSAKCAQCHARGNEGKGGGFVLLENNGSAARLDDAKILAVQKMIYQKKMPPQRSGIALLTDEELGEVVGWALSQK